jgi:hypothetical protein
MARKAVSYQSIMDREEKIYSIGNTAISAQGITITQILVTWTPLIIGILLAIGFCKLTGRNYFNVLTDEGSMFFIIFTLAFWGGIGSALWHVDISGYRLYQYLKARLRIKREYRTDFPWIKYVKKDFKIDCWVKERL